MMMNRIIRMLRHGVRIVSAPGAVAAAVSTPRAPRPVDADAPEDVFSARRAERLLRGIAVEPRPIGSPGNARARAVLVEELRALGTEVTVQDAVAVGDLGPAPFGVEYRAGGRVCNIVARLPGTAPGPAVLLMTHYDSVEQGPGASDAGMLVAAVLETLRALRAGPALRNDVIVLLTDGEEAGLLGARAFFAEHPAAAHVRAVLNFEARGTSGPALMFETGPGSGSLVRLLADTPDTAVASSLFDEAYQRMPNTTDFAFAKEHRLPGLNFANISGFIHYHGPDDDLAHVDPGTLQHHGANMLGLLRRLGRADLDELRSSDRVFFSLGGHLMHYPVRAALPLALLGTAAATHALVRRRTPAAGRWITRAGTGRQAARLLVGAGAATALTLGLGSRTPQFRRHGDFPDSGQVYGALVGLAAALTLADDRAQVADPWQRLGGTLPPLAASAVAISARLPGGSYLPTWPLIGGAAAALASDARPAVRTLGALGSAAGAAALLGPLSQLLYQGLTPRAAAAPMLALQLGGELAAPALGSLPRPVRRALAVGGLMAAAGVVAHRLRSPADAAATPATLSYLMDADAGRAVYFSSDARPTGWTRGFLGDHPEKGLLPEYFPGWDRDFLYADAESLGLHAPTVDVLGEEPAGPGRRRLTLHVASPRGARQILLAVPDGGVHGWSVEGRSCPPARPEEAGQDRPWELWLYAPGAEGLRVELEVDETLIRLRAADRTEGLPAGDGDGPRTLAAALDIDSWGNGTFVLRWLKI
jgi:hypothetical protein